MKTRLILFVAAFSLAWPACSQVTVEVVTTQDKFLAAESLPVAVKIVNRSGRTLNLGGRPDWLTFTVEGRDGFVTEKTGDVPVLGEFQLKTGEVATRRVDLAPYFLLTRSGGYQIEATVLLPELGGQATSKAKDIDVIEGATIWSQEFGVPPAPGATNQQLEVRRYALLKASYLRSELRLYFRVTDEADKKIIKVFPIGPMVSFSEPRVQLDGSNNMHLIYQSGRVACLYVMITPDGEILRRETYDYTGSRPRLAADESGNIKIVGGVRRPMDTDVPAPAQPATATGLP
jgi:hypothetical protein